MLSPFMNVTLPQGFFGGKQKCHSFPWRMVTLFLYILPAMC